MLKFILVKHNALFGKKNCAVTVIYHPSVEQWKWNGTVSRCRGGGNVNTLPSDSDALHPRQNRGYHQLTGASGTAFVTPGAREPLIESEVGCANFMILVVYWALAAYIYVYFRIRSLLKEFIKVTVYRLQSAFFVSLNSLASICIVKCYKL